jgi:hypothetical protein
VDQRGSEIFVVAFVEAEPVGEVLLVAVLEGADETLAFADAFSGISNH